MDSPFKTIAETSDWIVVDKPAGMLTVPSRQGALDERPCLKALVAEMLGRQIWAVHRLDVEVSGLVLFAKTADFHRSANQAFENHLARKTYEAVSARPADFRGEPGQEWTWKFKLVRGKKRSFEAPHGKLAITRAHIEKISESRIHWTLWPETGRSHQLRVSLARIDCPIVGDRLYGSQTLWTGEGIALRAVALKIADLGVDVAARKLLGT